MAETTHGDTLDALDALLTDAELRLSQERAIHADGSTAEGLLSVGQEYLWSHYRLDPGNPSHNRSTAFKVTGALHVELLSRALDALIDRHPELRSSFPSIEGRPQRTDSGRSHLEFDVVNLREQTDRSGPARSGELSDLMRDFVRLPFDLESDPLIRARVFRITHDAFVLHLVIHHIGIDAWSAGIIMSDLRELYNGRDPGSDSISKPPWASYSDHVAAQQLALQDGTVEAMVQRALRRLEGAPTLVELPTDRKRPPQRSGNGVSVSFPMDAETLARAEAYAMEEGATLHMLLSAIFAVLVHRYTGLEDILIGVPYAGRDDIRFERTVGLFMNFLVLRADLRDNPSFQELLSRIRTDSIEMMAAAEAPFELVARRLHADRNAGHTALVQVLFNMEADRDGGGKPGFSPIFQPFGHDPGVATHDLGVEALRSGDHLTLEWTGNADIFDVTTIRRMAGHFGNLLTGVLASPKTRLDALPLISTDERSQLLAMSRSPDKPYPKDKPLHVLFEEWVEKAPDKTAIFDGDVTVTYRQLNERANQLAHFLIEQGVGPGDIIPVFLERSIELAIAWIAVSKSGAAFIGLDPLDPVDRIVWIAADVHAPLIVASGTQASQIREREADLTIIDPANQDRDQSNISNPDVRVRSDEAAILLYTSGSTGTPKGVLSSHRSLTSLVFRFAHVNYGPHIVSLMISSPSFDAALDEIWAPLIHGGSTVVHRGRLPSARAIRDAITKFGINDIWLTASLFHVIVDESLSSLEGLDHIRTGGEILSVDHAVRAAGTLKNTSVLNWYGPTEATVIATSFKVPPDFPVESLSVPIGKPLAGRHVYILDRNLEPAPIGVPGEIFIGGDGLAIRYINDPELTVDRFVPDPFVSEDGARMYRTGDLARFLPSGDIEFVGRIDRQIKLRGIRIEPAEIEAVLMQHPGVRESAVVVNETAASQKMLIAFYTLCDGDVVEPDELRTHLNRRLSRHLVPSKIVRLDRLPRLKSGKIDTAGLLQRVGSIESRSSSPPSTNTERRLAELWTKLLKLEQVGATDDFFALGGDSLSAVRLFEQIDRMFDVEIPISSIFDAQTIREQALLLENTTGSKSWSSLINVKPYGSNRPFFLVAMTDVVRLKHLAAHLPEDQPLFGLQAPGLWKRRPTHSTIEEMAQDYRREIVGKQPRGPYQLGGVCVGAIVAFEIAKLLRTEGREVRCLIAFDTVQPPAVRLPDGRLAVDFGLREATRALKWKNLSLMRRVRRAPRRFVHKCRSNFRRGRRRTMVQKVMYRARAQYVTARYDGPIDLLESEKPPRAAEIQSNWRFTSTFEIRTWPVSGSHRSMWDDEHIENIASVLMDVLEFRRGSDSR